MTNFHMLGDLLDPISNKIKRRRKERQERNQGTFLILSPPNGDILICYVAALWDDVTPGWMFFLLILSFLLFLSFLFLVLTASFPHLFQEPQKKMFFK